MLIISYLNIKIQILIICYWDSYKTDYNIIYFIIAKRIPHIMFVLNSEHISKYLNNILINRSTSNVSKNETQEPIGILHEDELENTSNETQNNLPNMFSQPKQPARKKRGNSKTKIGSYKPLHLNCCATCRTLETVP